MRVEMMSIIDSGEGESAWLIKTVDVRPQALPVEGDSVRAATHLFNIIGRTWPDTFAHLSLTLEYAGDGQLDDVVAALLVEGWDLYLDARRAT